MFTTIVVQPIFNLLVLIYNLLPGHNFGSAIIIFTIIIRTLMWPLVKKQINQAKAMRELAPEIKKIKQASKGDRQKESRLTMELYKEREINPFASIGVLLIQAPILIGLYIGIQKIVKDPHTIITLSYSWLHFGWLNTLALDITKFDNTLWGLVDLTRPATGPKGLYFPALVLVVASAAVQFFQSRQLMPTDKDSRGLRQILSDAGKGRQADQGEVNAAVGRGTLYLIPGFVLLFGLHFPAALPLYWLVSSGVALWQQSRILRSDVAIADASVKVSDTPKPDAPNTETTSVTTKSKVELKVTRTTLSGAKTNNPPRKKNKRRKK